MSSSEEAKAATAKTQQQQQQQQQQASNQEATKGRSHVKFDPDSPKVVNRYSKQEEEEQVRETKMEDDEDPRPFDIIIFAASSSVGRYLVEELALVVDKYYPSSPSSSSSNNNAGTDSAAAASSQDGSAQYAQVQQTLNLRRRSVPSSSKSGNSIRWAIAGRSAVRLSETLCQAELSTGIRNLSGAIPVILADLNHQSSLLNMCKKSRLVINCAGPYSELGAELLIQACIESGTHYVDLAHETTFIESITKLYSERAKSKRVLILNGCGFQSMSAECGINFMKQVVDGRIEQVKIILSLSDTSALVRLGSSASKARPQSVGIVSRGMWNSLLIEKSQEISIEERMRQGASFPATLPSASRYLMLQNGDSASENEDTDEGEDDDENQVHHNISHTRQQQQQEPVASTSTAQGYRLVPSTSASAAATPRPAKRVLKRKDTLSLVKDIVQYRNRVVSDITWPRQLIQGFQIQKGRGYCWPIDGLTSDESQLIRGEMNNYELRRPDLDSSEGWRPIRTSSYFSVKSFTHLCMLFLWLFVFQILIKFSLTRFLMRKLPQLASLGHVTSTSTSTGRLMSVSGSQRQTLERDSLSHIKYCQTFIAYGRPSDDSGDPLEARGRHMTRRQVQLLVSRVVGPEPNHVAAATFAVQAALTVLMERDHLPASGGVLTPGAAFSETNIIYQLRRRNIKFEVLKKA